MPYKFDLQEFFNAKGLELEDVSDQGLIVKNEEGQKFNFNPGQFLAANKISPSEAQVIYNTPETALNKSPVGLVDRLKMAVGNSAGSMALLKKKFSDVQQTEDGLVVKNQGVWQKVDPDFFGGDIREKATDIAEMLAGGLPVAGSVLGSGAGLVAGATAGALTGFPAGGIPGAALGASLGAGPGALAGSAIGGAAGETIRTSLGRVVGTYKATPEERIQDIGFEGLLGLGGEVVGLGAKVGIKQIGKALTSIKNAAAPESKQAISQAIGGMTGVGPKAVEVAIENGDEVAKQMQLYKNRFSSLDTFDAAIVQDNTKLAQRMFELADERLSQQYATNLGAIADKGGPSFSLNFNTIFDKAKAAVEETGAGKFIQTKKGWQFAPLSPEEFASRAGQEGAQLSLDPAEFQAAKSVADQILRLEKIGELKGKRAVFAAQQINSGLNKVSSAAYQSKNAVLGRVVSKAKSGFENGLIDALKAHKLDADWGAMQAAYAQTKNLVSEYRRVLDSDNGARLFADRLMSESAAGRYTQGKANQLIDFLGDEGKQIHKSIITKEAARKFAPILPRAGILPKLVPAGAVGVDMLQQGPNESNVGTLGTAAAAGALVSPRLALSTIRYSTKLMNFLKGMPGPQRQIFLKNPQLVNAAFSGVGQAVMDEARGTEMLLQQMGVKPNDQQ